MFKDFQKYKGHLIPTPVFTGIQGLAYIIFLNKYSITISIYTFRTLPFPAMISLLVFCRLTMTTRKERLKDAKKMLSWSEGSGDEDELADEEKDSKIEKTTTLQTIEDIQEFFKAKKAPENRITPKYLKVYIGS